MTTKLRKLFFFHFFCKMSEEGENSKKRVQDEEPEGANSVPAKKLVADLEPVLERAVTAIRALKSHSGSSLKAIQKQLSSSKEEAALLKDALKLGVQQKKITQNKMSFLVTGENYPDPTPRIEVLETVAAADANAQKCKDGEAVTVSYVGTLAESGVEFDKGEAYFVLGEGEVIAGLEQGTRGMAVGEKRKLKIPPSLGYGKRASGAVPANSVLLFEVELKSIGGEPPQALEEEEEEEVEEEGSGDYAGEGGSDE